MLIRNTIIIDPRSPHHRRRADVRIHEARIDEIGNGLEAANEESLDAEGACLSPGWIDIGVQVNDPGLEQREDLQSAAAAAMAGGFTGIGCQPNTEPVVDSKAGIHYLQSHSKILAVDLYPIGAVSAGCRGKDITEMIDMHRAGAMAFSDGNRPVQHGGLMMRALQYVTAFDGVVINQPMEASVAPDGQMHEGMTSTSLGMKGIPGMAEEMMVQRDLQLLEYTGARLHLANISTAGAVDRIREAKARGLRITCSVAAANLAFTDDDLERFDTNLKVLPPLRSEKDRKALREGLQDGTIDIISAHHVPLEEESKKLEFPFAEFGAEGLETAFAVACTELREVLTLEQLLDCFTVRPSKLFGQKPVVIEEGQPGNLTLFDPEARWTVTQGHLRSKSHNNPFLGKELQGRVLAVFNKGQSAIFDNP